MNGKNETPATPAEVSSQTAPAEVSSSPAADAPAAAAPASTDTSSEPTDLEPELPKIVSAHNALVGRHMVCVLELDNGAAIAGVATHSFDSEPQGEQRGEWKRAARANAEQLLGHLFANNTK